MEGLINLQFNLFNSIRKGLSNYKKGPKERITLEYVEVRLENLERDWELFRSNNTKLYEEYGTSELAKSSYVTKELYESVEDNYVIYKSALRAAINDFNPSSNQENVSKPKEKEASSLVRLPKITIPIFSGTYTEWTPFRDLFVSLVHNNSSLDNVQKLHYLKTHLIGEASQLIKHTPITDANYAACWSLLERRYNNKKYLANCILKRLFGQRRLINESASGLKDLLDTTMDCMCALRNIDVDVTKWDIIVIHIVTFKLDPETQKQWELHINTYDVNELPTLDQLKEFMENRFRALEFVETKRLPSGGSTIKSKSFLVTNGPVLRCELCNECHKLCFCKKFSQLNTQQRRDFVAKNSICFNCLGSNHSVKSCKKPTTCKICRRRHHTLLHQYIDKANDKSAPSLTVREPVDSTDPIISCLSRRIVARSGQVILPTALVDTDSAPDQSRTVRALLDQGSQTCFITEAAVQLLNLEKIPINGTVTGFGGNQALTPKYKVDIKLRSRINTEFSLETEAYVIKNITSYLPEQNIVSVDWITKDIVLADPQFNLSNKIDILLGANVYSKILLEGIKRCPKSGSLIAQQTSLGWIVSGAVVDIGGSHNIRNFSHLDQRTQCYGAMKEQDYSEVITDYRCANT